MVHRSEVLHGSHFQTYYQWAPPSQDLAAFVEHYWRLDSYRSLPMGVAEHFVPGLASRLVFPFDNGCYYQLPGQIPRLIQGPHLVPPQARPLACLHPASKGVLGLSLTPSGLAAFGGARGTREIQLLPEWQTGQAVLANCGSFEQQCHVFNQQLPGWFFPSSSSETLRSALAELEKGHAVAETAAHIGLSARSLQRLFLQTLGHSPRTCQRVLRLRRTLQGNWQNPAQAIWDSDYCDYSHFFKEFKALMGQSPSGYLRQFSLSHTQA
jgi:AraC-like DNA-binding protein